MEKLLTASPALEAALAYAERGWPVFPCKGKRPLTRRGCHDATRDVTAIEQAWRKNPSPNIGMATGDASGIWVLDVDGPAGEASLKALQEHHGMLPPTVVSLTGGGGRHLLFRYHGEPIKNRAKDLGDGLDVRSTGGYIIVPPSRHPDTGQQYRWADDLRCDAIADAPAWLIALACGKNRKQRERESGQRAMGGRAAPSGRPGGAWAEKALENECRNVAQATKGGRNDRLNRAAFSLGQLVGGEELERGTVERALFAAAAACGLVAEDGEAQVLATIKSGLERGLEQPRERPEPPPKTQKKAAERVSAANLGDFNPTEDGIALAFAERFRDRLLYCHSTGGWHVWTGSRWQKERTKLAFSWARDLCRELNETMQTTLAKASTAGAVEKFAQSDRAFAVTSEIWDKDHLLLNTPGGTVDLRTGKLREARPEDYMTKQTSVTPAPHGEGCPLWLEFLKQATNDDKELTRFLRQMAGYCLSGDVTEECLFFVYGLGGNGKGVFLNTIGNILGDYATASDMATFTASNTDRHTVELAKLRGARMVTASETEKDRAWAEARIKELTGNERPISARFMNQNPFEFWPTFKLVFVGNHKPILRNVDDAMRRRVNIIPFIHKPKTPDKRLKEKLRAEYPAILRWAIDGFTDWQQNGLTRPKVVIEATAEYFSEQGLLRQWIEECCDTGDTLVSDTTENLYASWIAWTIAKGKESGSQRSLSQALIGQGYESVAETPRHRKKRGFLRISVKPKDTSSQWQNRMESD